MDFTNKYTTNNIIPSTAPFFFMGYSFKSEISLVCSEVNQIHFAEGRRVFSHSFYELQPRSSRKTGTPLTVIAAEACRTRGAGRLTGTGVSSCAMTNQLPAYYFYMACPIRPTACGRWASDCTKQVPGCWGYEYLGMVRRLPASLKRVGRIWPRLCALLPATFRTRSAINLFT